MQAGFICSTYSYKPTLRFKRSPMVLQSHACFVVFTRACISFTSYKQPIRISNLGNKILFIYFLGKYVQDKRTEYIKKRQYDCLNQKFKITLLQLKLVILIFVFYKIGCSYELNEIEIFNSFNLLRSIEPSSPLPW